MIEAFNVRLVNIYIGGLLSEADVHSVCNVANTVASKGAYYVESEQTSKDITEMTQQRAMSPSPRI